MAPSSSRSGWSLPGTRLTRRLLWALACSAAIPLVVACNGIIGLSDYTRGECSGGGVCGDGGLTDTLLGDGSPDVKIDAKTDASGTLPVSWAAWPMPNYDAGTPIDNSPMGYDPIANQGFEDRITGLVWRHPMPTSELVSYQKALEICSGEWRLPSRIELVTLLDLGQSGAKIDPVFKVDAGTVQGAYWTFSEVRSVFREFGSDGERKHWVVDFGTGGLDKRDEGGQAAVRCVKKGGS